MMRRIASIPNIAVLLACLAWLVAFFGGMVALGDPRPVNPDYAQDVGRFEKEIQQKDRFVKAALVLSVVLAACPFALAFRSWRTAKMRFLLAFLISTTYLGSAVYYVLIT
jgi:hypothetical protein